MKLTLKGVSKFFGMNGTARAVLRDIDFSVGEGQFVTLLGPSGCGKTTLLTIIAGFQTATGGEISLNGQPVTQPGPDRGFVFQDFALFPWMTVKENILYPMKQKKLPRKEQQNRLKHLLAMAQLAGSEHLYPSQISGGMKQRTAVIRALACNPEVLLMDEPLGAVDHQMRQILQQELESLWLKNRTTVLMVTHDVDEAVYLSDRVIVMSASEGSISEDLEISLARPRERKSSAYRQYKERLTDILKTARINKETTIL